MHRSLLVIGVACTTLIAAAPRPRPHSSAGPECDRHWKPFSVPPETVFATVKTIALFSPWVEPAVSDSTRQRGIRAIDSLVQGELHAAGFASIAPAVADSLWKAAKDSAGDLYDARTGRADSTKMAAARRVLWRALHERFQADALLYLQVRVVAADFEKWTVTWDGTKQTFGNLGHHFMNALLHDQYKGRTHALSLVAFLDDTQGRRLYESRGGLQVSVMPQNGRFVDLPDSVFFADTARNAAAVHIALCHLVTRGGS